MNRATEVQRRRRINKSRVKKFIVPALDYLTRLRDYSEIK